MATTYAELYNKRCEAGKPTFWIPQPLRNVSPCLFGDDTLPVHAEWNTQGALQRCIALALQLEMPVGEWVGSFTKTEKSSLSPELHTLLLSNIKDETYHYKGFEYAATAFPIPCDILKESVLIGKAWNDDASPTLVKAGFAEMGVFMISLAILRLLGGTELANLSQKVAEDESRHVATNRAALRDLGYSPAIPSASIQNLINDTLEWMVGDLSVKGDDLDEDYNFDLDFLMESSRELVQEGIAKRLNNLLDYQVHALPFEVSNESLYTRAVVE